MEDERISLHSVKRSVTITNIFYFKKRLLNFCESDVPDNVIGKSYTCSALLEDKYINFIDTIAFSYCKRL